MRIKKVVEGGWLVSGLVEKTTTDQVRDIVNNHNLTFCLLGNDKRKKRSTCKALVSPRHLSSLTRVERDNLHGDILPGDLVAAVTTAAADAVFAATGTRRLFSDAELFVTEPGAKSQKKHLDGTHEHLIAAFINCTTENTTPTELPLYAFNNKRTS